LADDEEPDSSPVWAEIDRIDAIVSGDEDQDNTEWFDLDNLFEFDRENDPDNLIGNRWLCRGDSFILQGYTGIGKSSLVLQMAMCWTLGRDFFGIKPKRALKILLIQAENNAGDIAEPLQGHCRAYTPPGMQ
jgi:RecA-family ATPase